MTKREPTAFVLSDGASLGAIQVGMLRLLYKRAIAPHFVVGTSVGAINGAFRRLTADSGRDRRCPGRGVGVSSGAARSSH